jgi:hypothetical protein
MAAALTNVGYALKVLQRQPDSSWKIQYQMFNQVQSKSRPESAGV